MHREDSAADMQLFVAVLGGRTPRSHIELHDVRFVVGRSIEETLPELRRQWFGSRKGLHLDAWMKVRTIDGWTVRLQPLQSGVATAPAAARRAERLWFVNLGGYRPDSLAELHHFGLVVAANPQTAKAAAKQRWLAAALQQHKDDLCAVDDCLAIEQLSLAGGISWQVELEPHPEGLSQAQVPDWYGYRPI